MAKKEWVKARCQVCGKEFDCLKDYIPVTCGKFDCLAAAKKQGLFKE
jgi:hypothetical protein